MRKHLFLSIFLLTALASSGGLANAQTSGDANTKARIACTMEAKLCQDGSFVGRTGPNCEFSACPGAKEPTESKPIPVSIQRGNVEAARKAANQRLADLRKKIGDEKDQNKARIKEARVELRQNALGRFDAAVARIDNLMVRVNLQIAKFEIRGVDVTSAKSSVALAETKLEDAKAKILEINNILATSLNELSAANKATLVALGRDTQSLIKDARLALIDAVRSLKDAIRLKTDTEINTSKGSGE